MRFVVIYETTGFRHLALDLARKFANSSDSHEIFVVSFLPSSSKNIQSRIDLFVRKFLFSLLNSFYFLIRYGIIRISKSSIPVLKYKIMSSSEILEYQFDLIVYLGGKEDNSDSIQIHKRVLEFRFADPYPSVIAVAYKRDFIKFCFNIWAEANLTSSQIFLLPTQSTASRNLRMISGRIEEIVVNSFKENKSSFHRREFRQDDNIYSNFVLSYKDNQFKLLITIRYLVSLISEIIKDFISKLYSPSRRYWQIALTIGSIDSLKSGNYKLIANPSDGYFADPFLLNFGGEKFIFCEEFNSRQKKGVISAIHLINESYQVHHGVIEEKFHLSYPFPFVFENKQFICPESGSAGELLIYQSLNSPLHWELVSRWAPERPLYDPQIFESGNLWWLLATVGNRKINDFYSELVLYWSDNPISGTWNAHSFNPIFIDSMRGRNAGFISRQDKNFRIGQRYGFRNYGAGFTIFEIDELSKESYSESFFLQSDEIFSRSITQSHHIHESFGMTVFDFKESYKVRRKTKSC